MKYDADWIKGQVRERIATALQHHDCGICGEFVMYYFDGDNVSFDPRCGCGCGGYCRVSSYEEIAEWLAMQNSDDVRDSIMQRLR